MKTRNLTLQLAVASALAFASLSAQATTVTATAPVFARELLLGTTPAATTLTIPVANAINVIANNSIPAGSVVYVYVKLNGASISTIPSVAPGIPSAIVANADGSGAGAAGVSITLTAASLGTTTGSANPTGPAAGVDYIVFRLTTVGTPIGVGGTIAIIGGVASGSGTSVPLVMNNAAALLTAPITTTASVGVGAPTSRFGALPALASNYDATSAAVNLATQAQGITLAAAASTNAGQIDLTATPTATLFTGAMNTNTMNLGSITATNSTTALQADGATAYTIASQVTATNKLTAVVTAPAGFFAPLGTTGQLWLEAGGCTAAGATGAASGGAIAGSPSPAFTTTAAAAAATSLTLTATAAPASGAVNNICMGINKTIAAVEGTPTLAATLIHGVTTVDSHNTASASLYPVRFNGQQYDVRTYVPASAVGYTTFIRVINTGSVAAPVNGQFINADGTTSATATLIASLPAGGAVTLTSAQVEAQLGVPTGGATARPRLRLSAATNGMQAQSFLLQPGSVFNDVTGAQ